MNKKETLSQAKYAYIKSLGHKEHLLLNCVTIEFEVWASNKNHASYGIIYRNTHLEFMTGFAPTKESTGLYVFNEFLERIVTDRNLDLIKFGIGICQLCGTHAKCAFDMIGQHICFKHYKLAIEIAPKSVPEEISNFIKDNSTMLASQLKILIEEKFNTSETLAWLYILKWADLTSNLK